MIVSKLNEEPAESDKAAQLADALTHGGYEDWFLPSKDELNQMYVNLKLQSVGGFAGEFYWSSSDYHNDKAWLQNFDNGNQYNLSKSKDYRVRAVRAF